jgi:hypothetical protein
MIGSNDNFTVRFLEKNPVKDYPDWATPFLLLCRRVRLHSSASLSFFLITDKKKW